jgi:hypothetical protein
MPLTLSAFIGVHRRLNVFFETADKRSCTPIKADSSSHDKAMLCRNDIAFIRFYLRLSVAKTLFPLSKQKNPSHNSHAKISYPLPRKPA